MSALVVVVPSYPCGEPVPVVLRAEVVADGIRTLGTYYLEVPVPADRCAWHRIELRVDVASYAATAAEALEARALELVSDKLEQLAGEAPKHRDSLLRMAALVRAEAAL